MTDTSEKFLAMMLEGYENNLQGLDQYVETTRKQLTDATKSRREMEDNIEELRTLLGVEEEVVEEEVVEEEEASAAE